MDSIWGPVLSAAGIVIVGVLTYLATRGKDKTGGVNAYIDQLQEDRKADREEHRLQKAEWVAERAKLIAEFAAEIAQMKAAFVAERSELRTELGAARSELGAVRSELDAALADVQKLRQHIASISVVQTLEPPPTKENP